MIVGVHSDESYIKLKHKHTIDNTEKRMSNVKKYADQVMGQSSTTVDSLLTDTPNNGHCYMYQPISPYV